MIKGIFNKTQIKEFTYPLGVISNILDPKDDGGIILNVSKDTKEIKIFTKKHSLGTIIFVKYFDLINTFDVDTDEKIGILKIDDFIKYFSVIDDDNTEVEFKDNLFFIKDADSEISFKTADLTTLQEANKNFSFNDYICEIELDDKYKKLDKAIKSLSSEDYIYIKGSNNKITYTIKRKDIDFNKFKWTFDVPIKKDFEIIIKKELYQMASSINCEKKMLKIADRFICVESHRDNSIITMFVAKSNI